MKTTAFKLVELAQEYQLPIGEVMEKYNTLNDKRYSKEYGNFLQELENKSINILKRYYKIKKK